MGGACSAYGEKEGEYRVLVENPEGKRQLGRPRHRWEYNITMDPQAVGCRGIARTDLVENRDSWRALVNAVINLRIP
jgi:hypothetical protein